MSTEKILLQVDKPYQNHNGGTLLFGPADGYLYLPLGDGGRADDTGMGHTPGIGNAQDLTKMLGKVIRIDVDNTSPGKPTRSLRTTRSCRMRACGARDICLRVQEPGLCHL